MTDPREALQRAHATREQKRAALAIAQAAAARGQELVAALESELEILRRNGEIATIRRSEDLVAWAAGDAPLPAGRDARLVSSDAEIRVSHELNASLAANVDLLRGVAAAETALQEAESSVTAAAVSVINEEALGLAADLVVATRLTWLLRDRLQGLERVWIAAGPNGTPGPIRVTETVLAALNIGPPQQAGHLVPPIPWNTTLWSEYLARLATDATAQFEPRDPAESPVPPHARPQVIFHAQGDVQAARLAEQKRIEDEAKTQEPIPSVAASAIELARMRGQMPDFPDPPFEPNQ
jgi:hypothetical protein